jgi:signal transduction histidine kinase
MERAKGAKLDERTLVMVSVAKRQWERTFDAIAEPLMLVDDDFVIRRANLALADDLGTAIQQVVGRRCHEARADSANAFSSDRTHPCAGCPVPHARAAGSAEEAEMRSVQGRVYRLRAYPMEDDGGRMTVCSYRDVTEERKMARQLANAEKLASIGRLAGGVAHEINNPLGGILAFTQILLKESVSPAEQGECVLEIERSALRCKAIVESLLRFSRQSARAELTAVSLNHVVRAAVRTSTMRAPLGEVKLTLELAADLPPALGDAHQLEQVVVNLLTNAADSVRAARPGGGAIVVRTCVHEGAIELEVEDDGAGVAEGNLERIYDPFFTTKEEGRGTGLGLAVTYAIVQEHRGRISLRHREGGGAVFTVSLSVAGR